MDSTRLTRLGLIAFFAAAGCSDAPPFIVLGATTSTYDSGLLDHLVGDFAETNPRFSVRTVVSGTGQALELGRRGDVDILLVHAPGPEDRFVSEGHAPVRHTVMRNEFVLVGPPSDPAGVRDAATPAQALARVAAAGARFVSRGDSSGTHHREIELWRASGATADRSWYMESGQGQATTLQVASERGAYALTDEATFATLGNILELEPLMTGHPTLVNEYSLLLPVNARQPGYAQTFRDWLLSEAGRQSIETFRIPRSAVPRFRPWSSGEADPVDGPPEL